MLGSVSSRDHRWRASTRREWVQGSLFLLGSTATGCVGKGSAPGANAAAKGTPTRAGRTELEVPEMGRAVQRVVAGVHKREGAGFVVNRPFPIKELPLLDPFLLLDEFGPTNYGPGEAVGAPDHPHRGFETVSYVLQGDIHHRDSMGHDGAMGPGGVQWMTAGAGIVHSEMPSQELLAAGGIVHGFQLWVNLPRDLKMMQPHYQELQPDDVAKIETENGDATGRIIAGAALGADGAIRTTLPTSYQHWTLRAGSNVQLPFPPEHQVAAWVFKGEARLGATAKRVGAGSLAVFDKGEAIRMGAPEDGEDTEVLLLAAAPLNEPVARRGPFVMNTDQEIRQAYADYQSGKMGRIPPV